MKKLVPVLLTTALGLAALVPDLAFAQAPTGTPMPLPQSEQKEVPRWGGCENEDTQLACELCCITQSSALVHKCTMTGYSESFCESMGKSFIRRCKLHACS